ncbi:MAG: hypothetical protein COA52_00785 [Hyphomicrobiales bacterium]|nr:MAG: hypothetical protein COA52_00785 [Hyphomicrobiales bacterium]
MTKIITDLTSSPYFDTYDDDDQYVKILFKPALGVQTRELNQLQTILQNQISRFSSHIFKEGSVVDGVALSYNPQQNYIHLVNQFGTNTSITLSAINTDYVLVSNTGVRAVPELIYSGFISQYPATNRIYLNYVTTGKDGSNNDVSTFTSGETITVYNENQEKLSALDSNNIFDTIDMLTANGTANSTGIAYSVSSSDGIVYQKGYFSKVDKQKILVKNYDTNTTNYAIGFKTDEFLINNLEDGSLHDNALGEPNFAAPGADRLKLTPVLYAVDKTTINSAISFFPIAEFNNSEPVEEHTDPAYNLLGDEINRRTKEESGNYTIKPFAVETLVNSNTSLMYYETSPGIAYVDGARVELIGSKKIEVERAVTTDEAQAQIVTANFGNYVIIEEVLGNFDIDNIAEVDIYDTAQNAVSEVDGAGSAPSGSAIGTANIRSFAYNNGTKGTGDCQYRMYIFNVKMDSGNSFSANAKSFYIDSAYGKAKGDIVLEDSKALIKDSKNNNLVFDLGVSSIKRLTDINGVNDTQFVFRDTASATLQSNGFVTFTLNSPYAGGSERLNSSIGTLSDVGELNYDVALSTEAYSANVAGTVTASGNTITGSGTAFDTDFAENDFIRLPASADVRRITAIANSTSMSINADVTVAGVTMQQFWPEGHIINTESTNGSIQVLSNTQFSVSTNMSLDSGSQTVYGNFPVLRTTAVGVSKEIKKDIFVKIDCATAGVAGPFNLGLIDITKIDSVYVGATYSESNPDRTNWFYLDNGHRDSLYDHGKLVVNPAYADNLTASSKLLIKLNHFEANTTAGAGFFSVDSYPIQDEGDTANSTNINIGDIPLINGRDARGLVDFRPQRFNTANSSTTEGNATENPVIANTSFISVSSGSYIPDPDSNFQADIEYYLPRIDLLSITKDGDLVVTKGEPNIETKTPISPSDGMLIASITVPGYPSLTTREGEIYNRIDLKTRINLRYNRGYTMSDIGVLDKRLSRVEYYSVLNLLEQQTKDLIIPDENGLDRFKNGFFAEPFVSHNLGRINDFEYKIAIDKDTKVARPFFKKHSIDYQLNSNTSSSIQVSGSKVTLPFTSELYISQPYATKVRNCTESVWKWKGDVTLYPEYDHFKDEDNLPAVNVEIDLATPFEEFAATPFGTQFGEWRTVSRDTNRERTTSGRTTTTTTTTTTSSARDSLQLNVDVSTSEYNFGSFVKDISINPYMRSREIAFVAHGLKPNTLMHIFFDRQNMDANCAPGILSGVVDVLQGQENKIISRTADFGADLTADSVGTVYGIFKIPASEFRVGDREFIISDIDDLETSSDASLSGAKTIYTASNLAITSQEITLNTRDPSISAISSPDTREITSINVNRTTIAPPRNNFGDDFNRGNGPSDDGDPISQSFLVTTPESSVMFVDKLGLYFKTKDNVLGVTIYITEMAYGYPNTAKTIAKKRIESVDVNISSDGTVETVIDFDDVFALNKDLYYCFQVKPDGDSPEYTIWLAGLGEIDVATEEQVFSNPYIGVTFVSANRNTWTAIQDEDIKFNLYRAKFTTGTGTAVFENEADEYVTIDGINKANSSIAPSVGDVIYTANSTSPLTANSDPVAYVQRSDEALNEIIMDSSSGGFTANTDIEIHREFMNGESSISTNTLIATATIESIDNKQYSAIVPRFASIAPNFTSLSYSHKGTDTSYAVDSGFTLVTPETENEKFDKMRNIVSKSNEITAMSGNKSSTYNIALTSTNDFVSPVIDMLRKSSIVIENMINNDNTDEDTRYGAAITKYISREIVLKDNQDAEDFIAYVAAYRPVGTDVEVYIKFLNNEDYTTIDEKVWTKMEKISGENTYSTTNNRNDFKEYEYGVPATAPATSAAFKNALNNNILEYVDVDGGVYRGFKNFMIKIVLLSDSKAKIPMLNDARGIALQI